MTDPLIETWAIHDRINRYLLAAIPDAALGATIWPKFRTVRQLFAHLHNVRLMWLKAAAPDLLAGLDKLDGATGDRGPWRRRWRRPVGRSRACWRRRWRPAAR